jgi:phospholipase/carboxylesterase
MTSSQTETAGQGRLLARPQAAPTASDGISAGVQRLGLERNRGGVMYIPYGYAPELPAGVLVLLHGAGSNGRSQVEPFQELADQTGLLLLGPDSRRQTWDVLRGGYGPDIEFLDRALAQVFGRFSVQPEQVAVGGFSDGASYALSVGITNGDLFRRIVAFSPGFMDPAAWRGEPDIYVSHGTADTVLPIDRCSRRIVRALRKAGYDVRYHEFEGGHVVPPDIALEAFNWLRNGTSGS